MEDLLALPALLARTDGCTVRGPIRHKVTALRRHEAMVLHRPKEKEGLLAPLPLLAHPDGCAVRDPIRHEVTALRRS